MPTTKTADTFSAEEKAAMKEASRERKARSGKTTAADDEKEVLAKIAKMQPADRKLAERIHAIVRKAAPDLQPKTWYGMPAYGREGKAVVFFQDAGKFKTRYATLGFNGAAKLDDGNMWPTSYALTTLTPTDEAKIAALVKRAAG